MPELKIGDTVVHLPVIQGGMGVGISLSGLASAVANEGGIGVIAANSIGLTDAGNNVGSKDANAVVLRKEIRKAKKKTSGLIGVNIMVAVRDFHTLLRIAIEEKADFVFLGAGLPIKGIPVTELRAAGIKVIPIVSSARAAELIFKSWSRRYDDIPDGVVVEGPKAGGHLGFKAEQIDDPDFSLEHILPGVVAVIQAFGLQFQRTIPVIAAGGVFTGADIHRLFKLGASGVQMGTRFVGTHECDADIRFKKAYVACRKNDLKIIKSPVGLPGRAIMNRFLKNVSSGEKGPLKCNWQCLASCDIKNAPYCISLALDNARQGNLDKGFAFAGSNAFRVRKIISVRELLAELQRQYKHAEKKEANSLSSEYKNTLERLAALKEEYLLTLKNGLGALRSSPAGTYGKRPGRIDREYINISARIDIIKQEYSKAVEKANILKEELRLLFGRYSAFHLVRTEEMVIL